MLRIPLLPVVLVALGLGAAGLLWRLRPSQRDQPPQTTDSAPVATQPAVSAPQPQTPAPPAPAPPPAPVAVPPGYLESLRQSPEQLEAEEIALNLRNFGARFGGNPSGSNAEIVKTLNGGNPQGVRYLPEQLLRLNDRGELLDAWGTPYFFHQLSAQETEIRSAGPDKTMWTHDDLLSK